ncbi:hypothetical protein MPH_07737 [Macrophomina phaseolina MS6]|uniref:Uncharacterized protein n=1 Tax=Macrophomina phaseolina (strain MS6) TaxID=1126212 RepID=K2RY14_MACPH|nr:hypothetical protein MPH_07737 [Macrophomina phaseolina MS6]
MSHGFNSRSRLPRVLGQNLPFRPAPSCAHSGSHCANEPHLGRKKRSRGSGDDRHLNARSSLARSPPRLTPHTEAQTCLSDENSGTCRKRQKLDSASRNETGKGDGGLSTLSCVDLYVELTYNPWAFSEGKISDEKDFLHGLKEKKSTTEDLADASHIIITGVKVSGSRSQNESTSAPKLLLRMADK